MESHSGQGHLCACPTYALESLVNIHNKNCVNSDSTTLEVLVMVTRTRVVTPVFSVCHSALESPGPTLLLPFKILVEEIGLMVTKGEGGRRRAKGVMCGDGL